MSWIDAVLLNLLFSYQDHRKILYFNEVDNGSSMNTFAVAIHNSDQNISHSSLSKEEQNGANKNYKNVLQYISMQSKCRIFLGVCLLSRSHILIATFLFSKLLLKTFFFRLPYLTRLVKFTLTSSGQFKRHCDLT